MYISLTLKHCIHKYNNMIVDESCEIVYNFILYHYFDQPMVCRAPVCCSKYTPIHILHSKKYYKILHMHNYFSIYVQLCNCVHCIFKKYRRLKVVRKKSVTDWTTLKKPLNYFKKSGRGGLDR